MRASRTSIRARLVLLVLVATVPLVLFSSGLLERAYRVSAGLVQDGVAGYARQLAVAVDGQVGRAEAVAQALTEQPMAERPDLREFEQAASRALRAAGIDGALMLVDADGNVLTHSPADPAKTPGPQLGDNAIVRRVFETARPQVSGVLDGTNGGPPQIAVHVPVRRDGSVRYDAVVTISAHSFAETLIPHALPQGWFAIVADRQQRIIARTLNPDAETGQPIMGSFATLAGDKPDGFGSARSREGV